MNRLKRSVSVAAAALVMVSGIGFVGASQASARPCDYPTKSCNWEPTKELCLINGQMVGKLGYTLDRTPEPYKSRARKCVAYGWPSRG
ncbi:hypothetical protein [Streptomyces sp. MW-W600-10]|uniref:hypothetical protein n=1 Tax=Streptomyces sp. MW-W600-10 TaxID=2829819 RepID=UPI001C4836C9|nr:hypothetical protein [Streptomyces sp. MW-W600-10]MBV7245091.1 hypothetical protein [Streptomyces sp. MW-W600-10]